MICKYVLPFKCCILLLLISFLHCAEGFLFDIVSLVWSQSQIYIYICTARLMSRRCLLMCSSRNFMVSGLTFKSLIHFELFFLQSVNSGPVQFFCTQHQFSQYLFIEETVVFHCIFLPPFSQITWSYICGFISGLFVVSLIYVPVLLCVCVCVCVCVLIHTVLITIACNVLAV